MYIWYRMEFIVKAFHDLTLNDFHDIIALRIEVFVIEQNCPYQDLDGKDKVGFHLLVKQDGKIIGTTRILPQGVSYPEVSIGRVVIAKSHRMLKIGHQLMEKSMEFVYQYFGLVDVKLSAQKHLEKYYNHHGFLSTGKEYLEDGIPHVEMIKKTK